MKYWTMQKNDGSYFHDYLNRIVVHFDEQEAKSVASHLSLISGCLYRAVELELDDCVSPREMLELFVLYDRSHYPYSVNIKYC